MVRVSDMKKRFALQQLLQVQMKSNFDSGAMRPGLVRGKSKRELSRVATQFRINEREYEMSKKLHQMSRENLHVASPIFNH